jgi:hypothetical protein
MMEEAYLRGLIEFLKTVRRKKNELTHGEIRSIARAAKNIAEKYNRENYIFWLELLTSEGISHHDRSVISSQLLAIVEKDLGRLLDRSFDDGF